MSVDRVYLAINFCTTFNIKMMKNKTDITFSVQTKDLILVSHTQGIHCDYKLNMS